MDTKITRVSDLPTPAAPGAGEACLVQIHGPHLGKRFALEGPALTIGRGDGCGIVLAVEDVSRLHCSLTQREGNVYLRDEGSTNGTFLNDVELSGEQRLAGGDLVRVGSSIFKFLHGGGLGAIEAQYHEEIYRLTIVDGLTQLYNKRYLLEFLDREMSRCSRHLRPLSLVMIDVDHFKKVNDGFGHLAGDHVLRELAALLKASVRKEECLARYGGEELTLVLPETGREQARALAEKLRGRVEAHPFVFEGKRLPVTCSGGIAEMSADQAGPLEFLKAADVCLYQAKQAGRNRIAG